MLPDTNAAATLMFGGLALCHYNVHTEMWEVLFIRDEENLHDLKMIVGYGTPDAPEIPIAFGNEIRIRVRKPKSKSGIYMPTPDFTRTIGVDNPQDMRWTLNFSSKEMHGHGVTVHRRERDNFLSVPNTLCYTSQWSNKKYDLQEKVDGVDTGIPVPLSAIGEFVGGDIECEAGGGVSIDIIKRGGKTETYDLKDKTIVFFNNICDQTNPKCASDFPHYYDVLSDDGITFNLISQIPAEQLLEDFVIRGARYSCEATWVDPVEPDPPGTLNEPPVEP